MLSAAVTTNLYEHQKQMKANLGDLHCVGAGALPTITLINQQAGAGGGLANYTTTSSTHNDTGCYSITTTSGGGGTAQNISMPGGGVTNQIIRTTSNANETMFESGFVDQIY